MMATTHALWGMVLALPIAATNPELAPVAFLAGLLGGLAPDLDLYAGHRKTLHYPVYGSIAAAAAITLAIVAPSTATVALAVFLAAAAFHAASDAYGGGLELRPWEGTSERAVYSHYHGRWVRPRRWVRYDGAPEDLAVASLAGVPLLVIANGTVSAIVVALLAVSAVYVVLRRVLAGVAEHLVRFVPASVYPYVPARYRST